MRRTAAGILILGAIAFACGRNDPATQTQTVEPSTAGSIVPTATLEPTYAYPGGGPTDPMFPPGDPAYELLAEGKCDELLAAADGWLATEGENSVAEVEGRDSIYLYRSAAEACLGRWDDALRDFGLIGTPPNLKDECARMQVFEWLSKLLDARKADPGYSPEFVRSSETSPCPTPEPEPTFEPTPTATDVQ